MFLWVTAKGSGGEGNSHGTSEYNIEECGIKGRAKFILMTKVFDKHLRIKNSDIKE